MLWGGEEGGSFTCSCWRRSRRIPHTNDPQTLGATALHQEVCLLTQFFPTPVIRNLFSTQTNLGHEHPPLSNNGNQMVGKGVPAPKLGITCQAHAVCLTTIVLMVSQCMSPSDPAGPPQVLHGREMFQTIKMSTGLGKKRISAPLPYSQHIPSRRLDRRGKGDL